MTQKYKPPTSTSATVKRLPTSTRFKDMVNLPKGMSISEAIRRAEANVEACRGSALEAIDSHIASMQIISSRLKETPSEADERQIYLLADEIYSTAAMFGQIELAEAAYSLCELIGNRPPEVHLVWSAINVHIESLRLLFLTPDDVATTTRVAILEGLRQVTARLSC